MIVPVRNKPKVSRQPTCLSCKLLIPSFLRSMMRPSNKKKMKTDKKQSTVSKMKTVMKKFQVRYHYTIRSHQTYHMWDGILTSITNTHDSTPGKN